MDQCSRMQRAAARTFVVLLALAGLSGCRKEQPTEREAPPPGPKSAPTYQDPIAGILEQRCVGCHAGSGTEGSVPPKLTSYESASSVAKFIALVTGRRKMPPWGADDTGLCGRFQDSHWLEPDEITAFAEWAKAGAPRGAGEPAKPPAAPKPVPAPGTVSLKVSSAAYAPAVGAAATRCFIVEAPLTVDTTLTGLELAASPVHAVRQAQLHVLDTPEQVAAARALDAEEGEPGWACYGGSRVPDARLVASWSWGVPLQAMPAGSGVPLRAGRPLVVLLRYNVKGSAFSGRPVTATLELQTSTAAKPVRFLALGAQGFALERAKRQTEVSSELVIGEALDLLGVVPRMHTLGRTLHLERLRGTETTCLAHFGHWDVYEEQLFRYRTAFELEPGDRVRVACVYDTTSRGQETRQGDSIDDEACTAHLYVLPR
jgi:copper type II ascorbate-dependent monooxygenase-like protein